MNGLLLIDKPQDFTSFDVVAIIRKLVGTKKVGHTGTLDPMATGVLPVFFGTATRFCDRLPSADKRYLAKFKLGIRTDTQDIWGKVLETCQVFATKEDIEAVLPSFRGDIMQLPPMYSAIKINGQKLYDLARQNITVERTQRPAVIRELSLTNFFEQSGEFEIDVSCSKGTYIRTLIADIGDRLGCGATMTALCRTAVGKVTIDSCTPLKTLREKGTADYILSPETALMDYNAVTLTNSQAKMLRNGVKLSIDRVNMPASYVDGEFVRTYFESDFGTTFLGLSRADLTTGDFFGESLLSDVL